MTDNFPDAHTLLHRYGFDPKRSLGQNFLVDESYLGAILDAAKLTPDDTVLEIGPGLGVLTHRLAALAGCVVAIELDERLVDPLNDQFSESPNVKIVHGDILESDPGTLAKLTIDNVALRPLRERQLSIVNYKVVANLPYYITSPVLRHLLEAAQPPSRAVLMVQQEVAERICAEPGQMSILAVSVQFYAVPSIVTRVPAEAFYPRPNVDSAVLCLGVRAEPAVPNVDPTHFFRIVRAGFSQKRKQLLNSLSAGLHASKEEVRRACKTADVDPRRRAQTLSLDEWGQLANTPISLSPER